VLLPALVVVLLLQQRELAAAIRRSRSGSSVRARQTAW
jgi:hypothetical protein